MADLIGEATETVQLALLIGIIAFLVWAVSKLGFLATPSSAQTPAQAVKQQLGLTSSPTVPFVASQNGGDDGDGIFGVIWHAMKELFMSSSDDQDYAAIGPGDSPVPLGPGIVQPDPGVHSMIQYLEGGS